MNPDRFERPSAEQEIASTPLAPLAQAVFTPAELDARLAALARHHAAAMAAAAEPSGVVCMACGTVSPPGAMSRGRPRAEGPIPRHRRPPKIKVTRQRWHSRPLPTHHNEHETYCPECFAIWGWFDEPEND